MAKDKKYYYLKLPKGWFDRHDLKIIRKMPQGDSVALFYLMLLTESIDHDGQLRFDEFIPYDTESLSIVFDFEPAFIEMAVSLLMKFGLVERWEDETIFMTKLENMIGSTSTSTQRVREHRARKKQEALHETLHEMKSNPILELELEKEIDIELELEAGNATTTAYSEISKIYTEEIGQLTPLVADDIKSFIEDDKLSVELIIYAIREASKNNVKNWKYITAILKRFVAENVKCVADIKTKEKKPKKTGKTKKQIERDKYGDVYLN